MRTLLLNEIYGNLVKSGLILAILFIITAGINLFAFQKIANKKQLKQFRARTLYIACFILLFFMARIWVEGFTHLLAILGIVSAALVITNKESIMNIVGWLIITWRGLFAEDDLIKIQSYSGYVKSFGLFYFTIAEVSEEVNWRVTGRIIRVPNGLVSTNFLINLSQENNLHHNTYTLLINKSDNIVKIINYLKAKTNELIYDFYKDNKSFSMATKRKKHPHLQSGFDTKATISIEQEKSLRVKIHIYYYCLIQDKEDIQNKIWLIILNNIENDLNIKLPTKD